MKNSIAIIPARANSKRIKDKNVISFRGMPMIYWAIKVAKESKCFDRIIVSTDSKKIAKKAISFGAEVPFIRPKNISDDYTSSTTVIAHALNEIIKKQIIPEYTCCIYPCCPLIEPKDIRKAYKSLKKSNVDFIIPLAKYSQPIQRSIELNENNKISFVEKKYLFTRTQDLSNRYYDAGQFYIGKSKMWIKNKNIFFNSKGLVLPEWKAIDIDNKEDLERAKIIFDKHIKSNDLNKL